MNQKELSNRLNALKQDLSDKPSDRAVTTIISRYVQLINECMEYGYSRNDIYNIIFSEDDKNKININYFYNILHRARKKFKSKNRSVNNEPTKNEQNTIVKNKNSEEGSKSINAFEKLKLRQNNQNSSINHNSGSTIEDLENSLARITNKQD